MATLIMTKGLPAAGKTTWAKEYIKKHISDTKRVNKDDMRQMVHSGEWSKDLEKDIVQARDALIILYLNEGYNVVVDDTNLQPDHEKNLRAIAKKYDAKFKIQDFTDVPLNECLKRNAQRPNFVPDKAIKRMYDTFLREKTYVAQYKPPESNPDLPTCIIVDIDGTLAHMNGRGPFEYEKVGTDNVDRTIRDIVNEYYWDGRETDPRIPNTYVIIVSGREASCKEITENWLKDNQVYYDEIFMREKEDMRDDRIVKKEIYDRYIRPRYNVRFVLDDRNKVVKMWREEGLKVLQVQDGDF